MSAEKKLTPAEWEIMEAIWKIGGRPSIREVLDQAFPNGEKAYTTVQTLMNILVKKGLLKAKKIGLVNFYSPTITREEMVQTEMNHLVSKVFHGSLPALANYLFDSDNLSLEELEAIKKMLNQKENELRGNKA